MSKTVILPYDPTWEALFWAKAHCKSYITNDTVPETPANIYPRVYKIEYFFADERDATWFRLMWS